MPPIPERSVHSPDHPAAATPSPRETRSLHRHGEWSLRCDGDEITEIAHGGEMLLDSLRPAVRTSDWDTIPPRITDSAWVTERHSLRRIQTLEYHDGPLLAHAVAELVITAEALRCRFTLTADVDLLTNRIGLTAMLPRTVAGLDALVGTPSGAERSLRFPRMISPFQPAFDILSLDVDHGDFRARLDFSGDIFEMEDQRNWTDASFKIYSRPLALPFPYLVQAGEQVEQEVTLTVLPLPAAPGHSPLRSLPRNPSDAAALLRSSPRCLLPDIGTGATTQYSEALSAPASVPVGLSFLLVETCEGFPQGRVLGSAAREARALGVPADLRIIATPEADLGAILSAANNAGLTLTRVSVVDSARHVTTSELWERLLDATTGLDLELTAGARSHFTEFNREIHAIPEDADSFTFPSTPQMHMQETWHVISSVAALGDVLDSAAALHPASTLHLGPVTLRPRMNAVATRPDLVDRSDADGYGAHLVPGASDPRQHSRWAAAWAAAMILKAATAGARSVTLAELAGPRGLLLPDGQLAPIGEIVTLLGSLAGREAQIACDADGPGTAIVRCGDLLMAVNARLEDWELDLGGLSPAEPTQLLIPAGTCRQLTLPAVT